MGWRTKRQRTGGRSRPPWVGSSVLCVLHILYVFTALGLDWFYVCAVLFDIDAHYSSLSCRYLDMEWLDLSDHCPLILCSCHPELLSLTPFSSSVSTQHKLLQHAKEPSASLPQQQVA